MNKWADFGISHVRYNAEHTHIDKVLARPDNGSSLGPSTEMTRQDVIVAIKADLSFVTITKGTDDNWSKGQPVYIFRVNGTEYIKTVDNGEAKDNLENLPEF